MRKNGRVYCDLCKDELVRDNTDDDEPHGFDWEKAHAHCCHPCFSAAIDNAFKERDPCAECETMPCERGRDCWFEPSIGLPYETYFADRADKSRKVKAVRDNLLRRHRAELKWARIRDRLGDFGECSEDMCYLIDSAGGMPDVDRWAGGTLREWWESEPDGSVMVDVLRRIGMAAPVHRLDSADDVRRLVPYRDFLRAAEEVILEKVILI